MRKFSIKISGNLDIWHNHYLSDKFIKQEGCRSYFKRNYSLWYPSRGFDKPAIKWRDGSCFWYLDGKAHRIGNPAIIYSYGDVEYLENGEEVK